ncbi:hypothetical protein Agub_g7495 [Astrephomene gubernaculifera]|uniref:Uncharacterized protein n=1 Tax=Astrephomene gubernaculifera TaxID=47775 RepID=A0AAD3DQ56_9CHLO|nr:hypothetical protein Agub_g7495 [Astrephomene gubernaculifera]
MPVSSASPTLLQPAAAVLLHNVQRHERTGVTSMPVSSASPTSVQPAAAVLLHNVQRHERTGVTSMPVSSASPTSLQPAAAVLLHNVQRQEFQVQRFADHVIASKARGDTLRWRKQDVQVQRRTAPCLQIMLAHLASLPTGGGKVEIRQAMEKLGIAHLPDPKHELYQTVKWKLYSLRNTLEHGRDPLTGKALPKAGRGTYNYRGWLRGALLALPNREGTLPEVAAILKADPEISLKLNWRHDHRYLRSPAWRNNLSVTAARLPEFINTGRRKGKAVVYRYDEEVFGALQESRKPPEVPKHRTAQPGAHNT